MTLHLLAEASPCCPSPLVGNVFVAIYVVVGLVAYWSLAHRLTDWVRSRRARRRADPAISVSPEAPAR